ncbi:putative DNA ligase [Erwinia phage vB_EamM_Yoloswag]|uniref:Putative DNA ligase n=1 Tax=Erwinia phage vB_EamM_Yoloswag TaxID=1958956 RepID=A0A1S6L2T6_9CAUD|nr:DNA ligase [Erwinia phage vB_EamM_Yoloswag]AQT28492.1 putative DNA ligase [Erwinia phage vB_EamM_Yoloswag]
MSESKFFNPLAVKPTVKSTSAAQSVESVSSAFIIDNPNMCPKCNSATVATELMSGEPVMFCTNCRVSMAQRLE